MSQPLEADFPPILDLPDGYVLQWNAVDATTGANVANVIVKNVSIFGTDLSGAGEGTIGLGPFVLVPGPGA